MHQVGLSRARSSGGGSAPVDPQLESDNPRSESARAGPPAPKKSAPSSKNGAGSPRVKFIGMCGLSSATSAAETEGVLKQSAQEREMPKFEPLPEKYKLFSFPWPDGK